MNDKRANDSGDVSEPLVEGGAPSGGAPSGGAPIAPCGETPFSAGGKPSGPASPGSTALPCPGYPPSLGESRLLSEVELRASLDCTLQQWDGTSDIWLFGYGSLIWNPGLPTVENVRSRVHGYHRGLYLWSRVNRGTPEQPGLVLALDRGGSCAGVAFRLAADGVMPHLEALWRREMPMGSYRPAWLPCALADGRRVAALAFVMRRDVPTYTGKLDENTVRTVFGCAEGRYGTTLDYVRRTVVALRESGMPDRALERLLARCA